jgi:acyl-CoA synthetase (AMP-forming)/AMP-acid ligase II
MTSPIKTRHNKVSGQTIFEIFQQHVFQLPNNTAVQYEQSEHWSYLELYQAAQKMTESLQSIELGQLVAVVLPRHPVQIISILALAQLGAVYVPINPDFPVARIEALIQSNGLEIAICSEESRTKLPSTLQQIIIESDHKSLILEHNLPLRDGTKVRRKPGPDDLAAVLFTSGSTGVPKGVKLTHKNLTLAGIHIGEKENVGPTSSIFQFSACSFDVHLTDILCSLLGGAKLLQVGQDKMMSDLSSWIKLLSPDTIHLTPTVISMLDPSQLPSIKYLVTCGEPATPEILKNWAHRVVLTNAYGIFVQPSEMSVRNSN